MLYGSLVTIVAELNSFMKRVGSCQFLSGFWMDISDEVASIHTSTDAKNRVTTARKIHLPEQEGTIHIISILQKEACSGNVHDLARISNHNCVADCLTKASAEADNFITSVKIGRLSDVDIHPNFRNSWSTRNSYLLGAEHFCTRGRRMLSS